MDSGSIVLANAIIPLIVSAVNSLPVEMLISIFHIVLGNIRDSGWGRAFVESRSRIGFVCRHWRSILLGMKEVWKDFLGTQRSNADFARVCLERSSPMCLSIDLYLAHDDAHPAFVLLEAFVRGFPRVHSLCIQSADAETIGSIAPVLSGADLHQLRAFTIDSRQHPSSSAPSIDIVAGLPAVVALRLVRVRFGWSISHTLQSLRTLVLRNIGQHSEPSWADWNTISSAAPQLYRLCLRNFGCPDVPDKASFLTFPSVEYLDLAFGNDNPSLVALVSSCRFQALKNVTITSRTSNVLESLMIDTPRLSGVQALTIRFLSSHHSTLRRFFICIPNLHVLDVRLSEHTVFSVLLTPMQVSVHGFLCPNLTEYAVVHTTPLQFKEFMEARHELLSSVAQVIFVAGVAGQTEFEEDIHWLENTMRVGFRPNTMDTTWLRDDRSD